MRKESDTLGEVLVADDKLWGSQTQRSLTNFPAGTKMDIEQIRSITYLKKACAKVNGDKNLLDHEKANKIMKACDDILNGLYDDQFLLSVYQTGSGTQTNMNVNEVIAHLTGTHPNDDVNKSQSSNDIFPSAMHITAVILIDQLIDELTLLSASFKELAKANKRIIKVGRTHLQDAIPLSYGQEFSGYYTAIDFGIKMLHDALKYLYPLAIGGTAVGTGLNAPIDFGNLVAKEVSEYLDFPFTSSENKFFSLSMKSPLVNAHAVINNLAADLFKIANDIRFLASGPDCGLGELLLKANEPGSSIMPGKVNPTQCEALCMACARVFGNQTTIAFSASQGNFELNVFMPIIIHAFIESTKTLTETLSSFNNKCVKSIKVNVDKVDEYLNKSLMLVTCLNPYIGYENSAKIANYASEHKISLKEAAVKLNILTEAEFDEYFDISKMVGEIDG